LSKKAATIFLLVIVLIVFVLGNKAMGRPPSKKQHRGPRKVGKSSPAKPTETSEEIVHQDTDNNTSTTWLTAVESLLGHLSLDYLKTFEIGHNAPIVWCVNVADITKVENFVPAFLTKVGDTTWDVTGLDNTSLSTLAFEGDESISNMLGMYICHPETKYIDYFNLRRSSDGAPNASQQTEDPVQGTSRRTSPRIQPAVENSTESTINDPKHGPGESNVKKTSKKKNLPRPLPLVRNVASKTARKADCDVYYHAAFTIYRRHNLPFPMKKARGTLQ